MTSLMRKIFITFSEIIDTHLSKLTTWNTMKYTDIDNSFYNHTREIAGEIGAVGMLHLSRPHRLSHIVGYINMKLYCKETIHHGNKRGL